MPKEKLFTIKKVIEKQVGTTFCFAKFYHVTIHLQTGETQSCHHPYVHKIPLKEIKNNPSALHNTEQKKQYRKQMLESNRPGECDYCWNIEDLKGAEVSDRHINNWVIYKPGKLQELIDKGYDYNFLPTYIEVSFGNECQFKCGYCHPKASSAYWKEIEKYGPMNDFQDLSKIVLWKREEKNPYVDAWWKWWPNLKKSLQILRITGGEPLLQESTWRLFKSLSSDPLPHLEMYINSNLGVNHILVHKLCKYVRDFEENSKIKNFSLFTSLDTWGSRAEYIRTGLDLKIWEKNFHTYLQSTKGSINLMITFNALSVSTFQKLLEKILEWRKQYSKVLNSDEQLHRIRFQVHYLRQPYQYSINILPKKDFMKYMYSSLDFMKKHIVDGDSTKFDNLEYLRFQRVVNYMESTIWDKEKIIKVRSDFYVWFQELDRRRNTNFGEVFPEYREFMKKCEITLKAKKYLKK